MKSKGTQKVIINFEDVGRQREIEDHKFRMEKGNVRNFEVSFRQSINNKS